VATTTTAAGLFVCAYRGLFADPTGTWEAAKPVGIAPTLVAAACYGILVATRGETVRRWFELLPQVICRGGGLLERRRLDRGGALRAHRRRSRSRCRGRLRRGQPVALFLALALYGGALIVTPKLMRKNP